VRATLKGSLLVSSVLLLVGCAGTNFVRPDPDTFTLGRTTYAQVVQKMGEPRNVGSGLKNGKQVKTITYAFASVTGQPAEAGVHPARALGYFFYHDTLVGQEFISSYMSDSSNFDETKVEQIKKGRSTRADVIALMGKPTATFIAPVVKETSGEAYGYTYQTLRGNAFTGFKHYLKVLRISFDDKGVVSHVDYESTGSA
jgi:hypothetical protein